MEDTDKSGEDDVFNGQYSVLWCNLRDGFAEDIRNEYISLRSNNEKPFKYETIRDKMKNHQETWPEALRNEDAYFKYLEPYTKNNENYLAMLLGDKIPQRDWWLYYAFKYRDSKYRTGEAQSTYITLRLYDRQVESLQIKPYANMYVWGKFGSYERWGRATKNEYFNLEIPDISFNDTECYLYSADLLSEIGDLSPLKVGLINISAATKLEKLILGSSAEGYKNTSFEGVNVGANELLSYLNIENCVIDYAKHETAGTIDLSKCHGMKEVRAHGSNIKAITLADGGHLESLYLPETLTGFSIKNQEHFKVLDLEGYEKIVTLNLENTPSLPIQTLLTSCPIQRLRLKNIEWTVDSEATLETIFNKLTEKNANGNYIINGYNDAGNEVAGPQVSGKVYIDAISDALIEKINTVFPELIIVVNGKAKYFIRYVNKDNSTLYSYIANEGEAIKDPIETGEISEPTYVAADGRSRYTYVNWSYNNGVIGLPEKVTKPITILAYYNEVCFVEFEANGNVYGDITDDYYWVARGEAAPDPYADGRIDEPLKDPTGEFSFKFKGWTSKDCNHNNVIASTVFSPTFTQTRNIYRVIFRSNGVALEEQSVPWGETAIFSGQINDIKYYEEEGVISEAYECQGWQESLTIKPENYTSDPIYINALFVFIGDLNDISWETIVVNAASQTAERYKIGSTKDLTYTYNGESYTVTMELIALNFDLKTSGETATYTFLTKDVAPYKQYAKNPIYNGPGSGVNPTEGGWEKSMLRTHCNTDILDALEETLKNGIKEVEKISDNGVPLEGTKGVLTTTTDKIWVPSASEFNLDNQNNSNFTPGQSSQYEMVGSTRMGKPYPWFSNDSSRIRRVDGEAVKYLTRTAYTQNTFRNVSIEPSGIYSNGCNTNEQNYFPFGFCI